MAFCDDGFASVSGTCLACASPCANCKHETSRCTTCLQPTDKGPRPNNNKKRYSFGRTCYESCPDGTIEDQENMKCLGCQSGCITCSRDDQSICLECYRPLFLFNSKCIAQCPKGYRPSFLGDTCVVESDVPVVYFPLMILTVLAAIIAWAGQFSSRLTNPDLHKKLLTFYALTGLIDVIAMWFQLIISIFFICLGAVRVRTEGAAPADPHQYKL